LWANVFGLVIVQIGKLVNLARGVGLARDPDVVDVVDMDANEGARKGEKEKEKERRRRLWWEVMFYDTSVPFFSPHLSVSSGLVI
jgi:hypothetical protein